MKRLIEALKQAWHKYHVSRSKRIRSKNQRTFVYCKCGNEMVGDDDGQKNLSFIRDVYVEERNVVHYKCSKCGTESFFDFDHPCPISLPFTENDDIIERYRIEQELQKSKIWYEYEMFFKSEPNDFCKIDGWYPIATDRIKNIDKVEEYISSGLLRRVSCNDR